MLKKLKEMKFVREIFKEKVPFRAKMLLAIMLLVIFIGGGLVAFKFYDFTQNNPKFCISCHLMKPAYDAWSESKHADINCHDCHHLTIPEQNQLLVSFVMHRPSEVPERHGKIIVPWKYCIACHWEENEKFPEAPPINQSPLHAKHYFMEKVECSKCHGYMVHKFVPEDRFCVRCHENKVVHGTGMEQLPCLNCHTDRTEDLRPGRKKCLFCHGNTDVRMELIADGTMDVTNYQPDEKLIDSAIKIDIPKDAPMQFNCYECHHPHEESRPTWGNCRECHSVIVDVGAHNLHINMMGMACSQCHEPHAWKVTPEKAKQVCTMCHEYREPKSFLSK